MEGCAKQKLQADQALAETFAIACVLLSVAEQFWGTKLSFLHSGAYISKSDSRKQQAKMHL